MSNVVFASTKILDSAAAPVVGQVYIIEGVNRVFQACLQNGVGKATVAIEVSLDDVNFIQLATLSLDASNNFVSDGFVSAAPWRFVRANVTSVSGGPVSVYAGI